MADTQSLVEAAEKLGKLVAEHPLAARLSEAAKAVGADPEVSRLMSDFNRELATAGQAEQMGRPITDAQRQRLQTLQGSIASNLKVKNYMLAQSEFAELLQKISTAWRTPVAEVQQSMAGRLGGGRSAAPAGPSSGGGLVY